MAYPNKKCTFANRVVRRSKSQNISALALSLNRYHKSATPPFYSDIQSDTSFLIIRRKDNSVGVRKLSTPAVKNHNTPDIESENESWNGNFCGGSFSATAHRPKADMRCNPTREDFAVHIRYKIPEVGRLNASRYGNLSVPM